MKKNFFLALLIFGLCPPSAFAFPEPSRFELAPDFLQKIHELFPESEEVAPALLDYSVDPNLHFFQKAELSLTFIDEGASYRNSFGYFLYEDLNQDGKITEDEILHEELLFPNASKENSGGDLKTGDTLSLGTFPVGTRLGFFLVSDGFNQAKETYYSLDSLNPGGTRHLAMLALPDREHVVLGIEDLPDAQSDRDFNDLLFTFTTEPKSALKDIIEQGQIPVAAGPATNSDSAPEPSPSPSVELAEVSLQEKAAVPVLEGGGLGCSLNFGSGENGFPVSLSFYFFLYILYRIGKRYSGDISAAWSLIKKGGTRFHFGKDYKKKLKLPSQWSSDN